MASINPRNICHGCLERLPAVTLQLYGYQPPRTKTPAMNSAPMCNQVHAVSRVNRVPSCNYCGFKPAISLRNISPKLVPLGPVQALGDVNGDQNFWQNYWRLLFLSSLIDDRQAIQKDALRAVQMSLLCFEVTRSRVMWHYTNQLFWLLPVDNIATAN